jgi:Rieske 2Fe-2S family protein
MTAVTQSGLDALVARRRPGHSLEAAFYTSPEVLDLDLRLIFGRHWVFVASEPELPEPGDFVTVEIGRTSVILVRDDDMAVRAFHNVCRHRGSIILREKKGFVGNLVCPYHQWTYDLGGRLIHAENMPSCIGSPEHAL